MSDNALNIIRSVAHAEDPIAELERVVSEQTGLSPVTVKKIEQLVKSGLAQDIIEEVRFSKTKCCLFK